MLKKLHSISVLPAAVLFALMLTSVSSVKAQWTAVRFDSTNTFHQVFAVSSNSAFAIGTQPMTYEYFMLRTNDGGDNWDWITVNTATDTFELMTLFFIDANNGFAGGRKNNFQVLLKTTDNGNTWTEVTPIPASTDFISTVYFMTAQSGFASDGIHLFKTSNGGTSWATEIPSFTIQDIHFEDLNNGIASGHDGSVNAVVKKTTDGGQTWNTILTGHDPNLFVSSFSKIDVVSTDVFFTAMQYSGKLYRTLDAGLTWDSVQVDSVEYIGDFDFISADVGHILGVVMAVNEYKLLVTHDGGQNSVLEYTTGWNFYGGGVILTSISFPGETGFASATSGLIKKYTSAFTGIGDGVTNDQVLVSPNPASTTISIQCSQTSSLEIYDAVGKLIFNVQPDHSNGNTSVDISNWDTGIYFVKETADSGVRTGKIIKE